ncbi:MAG: hypothetical protein U0R26_05470 [Solirubrobacterales bacterium]
MRAGARRHEWNRIAVAAGTSTWLLGIVVGRCSWITAPLQPAPSHQIATLRFEREGTAPSSSGLKVTFYAVPVGR